MPLEIFILDAIQMYLRSAFLDTVMPIVTTLGNGGILWILCGIIFLIMPKTRRVGIAIAISLISEAIFCNLILKPLVMRTRPFDVNTAVQLLIARPKDYSFPSGHTSASFATVSAMYFGKNKTWIPGFVIAVFIAFSRLYLYVHYPTDVLAGAFFGIFFGWLGNFLLKKIENKRRPVHAEHEEEQVI